MTPRLDISFPLRRQWHYWFGQEYIPKQGEFLLNHARTGIVSALRAALPQGGRVGVVAYNCHTVANAVEQAGGTPVFIDITERLTIDIHSLPADLDALVVTNLFGIRNDISAIRQHCPQAFIIVDDAHGYGLPQEGDVTVYSINQGKFPSLGEGGLLVVNNAQYVDAIEQQYYLLPSYSFGAQIQLFCRMAVKALAYSPCLYWLVQLLKKERHVSPRQALSPRRMAPGVSRIYNEALPHISKQIALQQNNATAIREELLQKHLADDVLIGENAFMVVARCENPEILASYFRSKGIETATHFAHAIEWATAFGYKTGTCPMAEKMTHHLLMIPTYR